MSADLIISGFRPADERYEKMRSVYNNMRELNLTVPNEVLNFFDGNGPNEHGSEVSIKDAITPYKGVETDGFDIDLSKLPKDVTVIRAYIQW